MINGYKCFNKNLINRYGKKFEVGKIYYVDGIIKFGNNGNGFHFCRNLEDTLRYFDVTNETEICQVRGFGKLVVYNDEYNGYYDMYAAEKILVEKIMTREEIIDYALKLDNLRVVRFLMFYPLTREELNLFKEKFKNYINVLDAIKYYQEKDINVYKRRLVK